MFMEVFREALIGSAVITMLVLGIPAGVFGVCKVVRWVRRWCSVACPFGDGTRPASGKRVPYDGVASRAVEAQSPTTSESA